MTVLEGSPAPLSTDMNDREQLIAEIGDSAELAVASESSLKKDWLRPEKEAAWQDL
jgi:hypothetical protein